MIALVPVRDGALPAGAASCTAESGGRALVVGTGARAAADELDAVARHVTVADSADSFARLVRALADHLVAHDVIVLPTSPDGRDLAPALAHALDRPLVSGALAVWPGGATCVRPGGTELEDVAVRGPFVATLQWTGAVPDSGVAGKTESLELTLTGVDAPAPESLGVLAPDVGSIDLSEAARIAAGGAGLDGPERLAQLMRVASALGAAVGATRVVTDRGWIGHERQIGTTGVVVGPELYLAFGISGAVQHTSGLGDPHHVISVNTDPHCPMMQLADRAIVADANATLDALADRVGVAR